MADDSSAAAPEAIAATQAETQSVASFPPATIAMGDENPPEDWSPPQVNEQGFAIDGHGLPLNLRLRAAALAEAGRTRTPRVPLLPSISPPQPTGWPPMTRHSPRRPQRRRLSTWRRWRRRKVSTLAPPQITRSAPR